MVKTLYLHEKVGVFMEKARFYADKIVMNRKIKRIRYEKRYRRWLEHPTRKGKEIELLDYDTLVKMRNRFLKILLICFIITSLQTIFFLNTMGDIIGGVIYIALALMGFAHLFMTASIDWSIYRRWGNKKSFMDW